MGRKSPWTKEEYVSLYNSLQKYCTDLTLHVLKTEGKSSFMQTFQAYMMFKYPVVYLFVHYHYGRFEDLGMDQNEVSAYLMMYLPMVKQMTEGFRDGMLEQNVFYYDKQNVLAPKLIEMCNEVLYIENNF